MRTCKVCGKSKPESEFYGRSNGTKRYDCKRCFMDKRNARRVADLEAHRARDRAFRARHAEQRRRRRLEVYAALRLLCVVAYGSRCACCGENEPSFLDFDHVNNDGAAHRADVKSTNFYRWIIVNEFPPSIQLLCSNCNQGKARNGGICPHESAVLRLVAG